MRLAVFSHKPCWSSVDSPSGYATDGGFPFQMKALSQLFDQTRLVVPCAEPLSRAGEVALEGNNLSIAPLSTPAGRGVMRKIGLVFWLLRNMPVIARELFRADAVHAPIPGDIGTIGMLGAFLVRKPLFVRHCGNWLKPVTKAEYFWKWFMEKFAGGQQVMLATGGATEPPSSKNAAVKWIFSTSLTENELNSSRVRELQDPRQAKLIIVCRQDHQKGTGTVIESLPLIVKTLPGVSLDVVGDGASLTNFCELAENLKVRDRVTFHGKVNHEAVVSLLKQADLFCYPTRASEGFPKVVLEALASGLPVITTRVSVLPELIGAGGGLLLDDATPSALAEATVAALADREKYRAMSTQAIATARQYSLERWRDTIGTHLDRAWNGLNDKRRQSLPVSKEKLSICFLAGTLGRGGAERQLIYMLSALKRTGVSVRLLCLTRGEALESEIRAMGIPVTWVGKSHWRFIRLCRIVRELRREPASLIQSAHFYTNLYASVAAWILGIRSIGAIRNDLISEIKASGKLGWAQLHLPSHLVANTKLAQGRALGKRTNAHLLPNVVAVNGCRNEAGETSQAVFQILFAGRLTEQKRADVFLHTLRRLADLRPDLRVKGVVAGDGPLRSKLENLAETLRLGSREVEFAGEVSDLKPFYLTSDLLLLTSDWEGCPNVVLEAMGCALPVVATAVGGVPELVRNGESGFLVETGDVDSMMNSIVELIEKPRLRTLMGTKGRSLVMEEHATDRLAGRLLELYGKILSDSRTRETGVAEKFGSHELSHGSRSASSEGIGLV